MSLADWACQFIYCQTGRATRILNPAARSLGSIRRLRDYEILMIGCTDNGSWAVPGGAVDLGESVTQAAVHETLEEARVECAINGIRDSRFEARPPLCLSGRTIGRSVRRTGAISLICE